MMDTGLQYFTHEVDGAVYGAWYRVAPFNEIEVIGVGMLERGQFAGFSPESAAKSILEAFVRDSIRHGIPMPALERERSSSDVEQTPNASVESRERDTAVSQRVS